MEMMREIILEDYDITDKELSAVDYEVLVELADAKEQMKWKISHT